MKHIFLDYGHSIFDLVFANCHNVDNAIIVVDNYDDLSICKERHFSHLGIRNNTILTKEEFKELIFSRDKPVVKGNARITSFFKSLSAEDRRRFGIKNIFDCIEFGNRFFSLYEDLAEERKIQESDLYEWQKETFLLFEEIKANYKKYIIENSLEDRIFTYHPARVNVEYHPFKQVIGINLINLSRLEREIFEAFDASIYLQIKEEDYNLEDTSIKSLTIPYMKGLKIKEFNDSFTQDAYFVKDITENKMKFVSFSDHSLKNSFIQSGYCFFEKTELYSFFESLLELLESVEVVDNQFSIKISALVKIQSSKYFNIMFELASQDKIALNTLLKSGYKFIPKGFSLFLKLFEYLEMLFNINNFEDFFRVISNQDVSIFQDEKYEDMIENFYDALLEMESINENILLNRWKILFSKRRLSSSLIKFLLNILKQRQVKLKGENLSLNISSNFSGMKIGIVNFNDHMLKANKKNFFLTNEQRQKLGLIDEDKVRLEKKYWYVRALANNEAFLYYVKDLDRGLDSSPLVEEITSKLAIRPQKIELNSEGYYKIAASIFKGESVYTEHVIDGIPFDSRDVVSDNELSMGFYDFNELSKCKYKFYLKTIAKIYPYQNKVLYRIDPNLLGNIIHNILNDIGLSKRDDVLKGNFMVSSEEIRQSLKKIIDNEKFKIPPNYARYYEKVLFPFIVKGTISFYKNLSSKLKGDKVTDFLIEASEKRSILVEGNLVYAIKGKADLRIETERSRYIIDYKTGHSDSKQLDFYQILYYDDHENVVKWFYKFFDEQLKAESNINLFEEEIKATLLELMNSSYYERTENRSMCRYCEYLDICKVKGI